MRDLELLTTLWPSFPHFRRFAFDDRLAGIRLNSAMMSAADLDAELPLVKRAMAEDAVPFWFDIKGRQPRITDVDVLEEGGGRHLVLRLNHPVVVETPTPVLFKAGEDSALLVRVEDGGERLVFDGGPRFRVLPGESVCIRHPSFRILDDVIPESEIEKIERVKAAGIDRWFLSYVEGRRDVDRFLELVGRDAEVWLKIETPRGMAYVNGEFRKRDNLRLVAACGDLYVEIDKPHHTLAAVRDILSADPEACAASRMLLSVSKNSHDTRLRVADIDADTAGDRELEASLAVAGTGEKIESMRFHPRTFAGTRMQLSIAGKDGNPVPDLCDFAHLAWLYDMGYRTMMLCDEICLEEPLLDKAVNAFDAFRQDYPPRSAPVETKKNGTKPSFFRRLFSRSQATAGT